MTQVKQPLPGVLHERRRLLVRITGHRFAGAPCSSSYLTPLRQGTAGHAAHRRPPRRASPGLHRVVLNASGNEMFARLGDIVAEVLTGRTDHTVMFHDPDPGGRHPARPSGRGGTGGRHGPGGGADAADRGGRAGGPGRTGPVGGPGGAAVSPPRRRRPPGLSLGAEPAADPFDGRRDLAVPGVEAVSSTVERDRRDAGRILHRLDELLGRFVVLLALQRGRHEE